MIKQFIFIIVFWFGLQGCRASVIQDSEILDILQVDDCKIDFPIPEKWSENYFYNYNVSFDGLNADELSDLYGAAVVSRMVYEEKLEVERLAGSAGWQAGVIMSNTMFAVVLSNKSCVYLGFRGTDFNSIRDWMVNFKAKGRNVPSGKVHRGMFAAYGGMKEEIREALQSADASGKRLIVTGHSLGGALAGIFSYDSTLDLFLDTPSYVIDKLITFGQPLFVDTNLALNMRRQLYGRYVRVVNDADIVTRIPNWFTHFGSLLWLKGEAIEYEYERLLYGSRNDDGPEFEEYSEVEIPSELQATKEAYKDFLDRTNPRPRRNDEQVFELKALDDHSMDLYLGRVKDMYLSSQKVSR